MEGSPHDGPPRAEMNPNLAKPAGPYRGRLAPSPTGHLHLGHARTFWTAAERAREAGGALVLRSDDLDAARFRSRIESTTISSSAAS